MTPDLRALLERVEKAARELHAASCAQRGEPAHWNGRRTNRAYYRRRARALLSQQAERSET